MGNPRFWPINRWEIMGNPLRESIEAFFWGPWQIQLQMVGKTVGKTAATLITTDQHDAFHRIIIVLYGEAWHVWRKKMWGRLKTCIFRRRYALSRSLKCVLSQFANWRLGFQYRCCMIVTCLCVSVTISSIDVSICIYIYVYIIFYNYTYIYIDI